MKEDNKSKGNAKKIIKIILIILYQILVIIAFILMAVIILQRVSNSNQSIGGYRIFRVVTGSMEPEYGIGEVVISKEVNPKDIKVGDDIVYLGKIGEYAGKIIMHNVVGINTDENGNLIFHARGLQSNSAEDPNIQADQIYGVVKFKSNILTVLYNLATNIYTVFFIIIILVLNVFIAFNTPRKTKKKKRKQISQTNDEWQEDIEVEEIEDNIEKLHEQEEDEEDIEENLENNVMEEIEEPLKEETKINKKERKKKRETKNYKVIEEETLEKIQHEKMIHEQMKQMLYKDKEITNSKKDTKKKT